MYGTIGQEFFTKGSGLIQKDSETLPQVWGTIARSLRIIHPTEHRVELRSPGEGCWIDANGIWSEYDYPEGEEYEETATEGCGLGDRNNYKVLENVDKDLELEIDIFYINTHT